MNIAVNLVGVSKGVRGRDWKNTCDNIKTNVINCWDGHTVNTYVTTYDHGTLPDLLDYYGTKKHQTLPVEGSDMRLTYKKSLENLRDENVDFIISTRFDIEFFNPVSSYGMDFNKLNILFPEDYSNFNFVCDNFFGFPKSYLELFIESVQYIYDNPLREACYDLHAIKLTIESKIGGNIHMVSGKAELSNQNSFYALHRQ